MCGVGEVGGHNRCDNAFLTSGTVTNRKGITCSPHFPLHMTEIHGLKLQQETSI